MPQPRPSKPTKPKPPPNLKLQTAREALPSPSGAPDMCMSRRELAEAANTYVWNTKGQHTNLSERDIGRYERGEAHWPDHWRRYGLRGVLGADNDTDLGFYPNRKTSTTPVEMVSGVADAAGSDQPDAASQPATGAAPAPREDAVAVRSAVGVGALPAVADGGVVPGEPALRGHGRLRLDGLTTVIRPGVVRDDGAEGLPFQEFAMAAEESVRFTRLAGATVTGELLDQLRAEVDALATEYLRQPPYAVFVPVSGLRREIFAILDRHVPAWHLADLYVCAGQLTALLAHACADLGQPTVAEAHARTAWLCAELAGFDPLRAYVRWVQANVAYWTGRYRHAAEIAAEGRRHATAGSGALRLASQEARAWAACGDQPALERALSLARDERGRQATTVDEVGAFRFSVGKAAYYAAEARLAAGGLDNARRAQDDAAEAQALLTAEPRPCPELVAAAGLDLAAAHVALGDLDAADDRLADVFALPAERRTVPVVRRAAGLSEALSAPAVTASQRTADLREQLDMFLAYPATRELPA